MVAMKAFFRYEQVKLSIACQLHVMVTQKFVDMYDVMRNISLSWQCASFLGKVFWNLSQIIIASP